uniref:Anaphase-promoting complex subunit 1 n=1 Tax=Lygus hesperus TaxID=30085 RepID=A0A0A9WNE1_LYGHE
MFYRVMENRKRFGKVNSMTLYCSADDEYECGGGQSATEITKSNMNHDDKKVFAPISNFMCNNQNEDTRRKSLLSMNDISGAEQPQQPQPPPPLPPHQQISNNHVSSLDALFAALDVSKSVNKDERVARRRARLMQAIAFATYPSCRYVKDAMVVGNYDKTNVCERIVVPIPLT